MAVDPLFFAEEFAARRRRFIPIDPADIIITASKPKYKDYNFPFITGEAQMTGSESDYPAIFKKARETQFRKADRYKPTTRFEAMTHQAYQYSLADPLDGKPSALEKLRNLFVDSLEKGQLLVDTSRLTARPMSPIGDTEFSVPEKDDDPRNQKQPTGMLASRTAFDYAKTVSTPLSYEISLWLYFLGNVIGRASVSRTDNTGAAITPKLLDRYLVLIVAKQILDKSIEWIRTAESRSDPALELIRTMQLRLKRDYGRLDRLLVNVQLRVIAERVVQDLLDAGALNTANDYAENAGGDYATDFNDFLSTKIDTVVGNFAPGKPSSGEDPNLIVVAGAIGDFRQNQYAPLLPGDSLEPSLTDMSSLVESFLSRFSGDGIKPPPVYKSHGFLSRDFVAYLERIATQTAPPPCRQILFKDTDATTPGSPMYLDMLPFARIISPDTFGTPADPAHASRLNLGKPAVNGPAFGCPTDADVKRIAHAGAPAVAPINAATLEEAYDRLRIVKGSSFERYIAFISFIYLFFDHIPQAQPAITAMMIPLLAMHGGLINRGYYNPAVNTPLIFLGQFSSPQQIIAYTTFERARIAFSPKTDRAEAVKAVLQMYGGYSAGGVRIAMRSLIQGSPDGINEIDYTIRPPSSYEEEVTKALGELAGVISPDGPTDPSRAKNIYDACGIAEFDLPSTGEGHMVLPALLSISRSDIRSLIYSLVTGWFNSKTEYMATISSIEKQGQLYYKISDGRYAYTDASGVLAAATYPGAVHIVPIPPLPLVAPVPPIPEDSYLARGDYPPQPKLDLGERKIKTHPSHWAELLYPAYVSHAIIELELLIGISGTLVRSCLQRLDFSIVFPSDAELVPGEVTSSGFDVDGNPEVFSAIFEFPARTIDVKLPAGAAVHVKANSYLATQWFPGRVPNAPGVGDVVFKLERSPLPLDNTKIIQYQLTHALSIADVNIVPGVQATSSVRVESTASMFVPVALLRYRTKYLWTSVQQPGSAVMQFVTPSSGDVAFLPALDTELFIASLFDWRLQLYYLRRLQLFLADRTSLKDYLDQINRVMTSLQPDIVASIDNPNAAFYIRNNMLQGGAELYPGLRNLIFNLVGPTSSSRLSDILKNPLMIKSFEVTLDTRRFYVTQSPVPARGHLVYDIDINDYLGLLNARTRFMTSLAETPQTAKTRLETEKKEERERTILELMKKSSTRLKDPYSVLIDEIVIRALYK